MAEFQRRAGLGSARMPAAGPAAASILTVGTLAGSGVIAANGGAGNGLGGGGGGGRIAITYTANAFSGLMSAYGGGGYAWGGAGTIYTKATQIRGARCWWTMAGRRAPTQAGLRPGPLT